MRRPISTIVLAFVLGLATALFAARALTPVAAAQTAGTSSAQAGHQGMPGMQMGSQDMMKMHEKMMADMKGEQARLDDLVKKMNGAKGEVKTTAMADLLTELVRNHQTMMERMDTMHQHMMKMGK